MVSKKSQDLIWTYCASVPPKAWAKYFTSHLSTEVTTYVFKHHYGLKFDLLFGFCLRREPIPEKSRSKGGPAVQER